MSPSKYTRRSVLSFAIAVLLAALFGTLHAQQQRAPLRVAAAADLQFALEDIAQQYENQTGDIKSKSPLVRAEISLRRSRTAHRSTLFFSADIDYPNGSQHAGLDRARSL